MYLLSASSSCPDSIWFWRRRKLYVLLNSQEESVSLHFSFLGQSFLVYFNFFIFFLSLCIQIKLIFLCYCLGMGACTTVLLKNAA